MSNRLTCAPTRERMRQPSWSIFGKTNVRLAAPEPSAPYIRPKFDGGSYHAGTSIANANFGASKPLRQPGNAKSARFARNRAMKERRAFSEASLGNDWPRRFAGSDANTASSDCHVWQQLHPPEERPLAIPKFKIGQLVDFRPVRASFPASSREYKILRLLPREGVEQEYRIKSVTEIFERIARESELSRRS